MKTRLLAGASFGFMAAMIGAMGFASSEIALASQDAPPAITVLVANYSQASPAILAAAEREAGRILGQAGLRASWLECSVAPSTVSTQDPCQRAPEANGIRLRILAAPVQDKFQDSVFGFAVHPVLASVYYEFALRRARRDDADFELPIILGCVMAHELGHLLLGSNSHFDRGIMLARWEVNQVRQLMMGTLRFTPEQSKLMRLEAQARSDRQNLTSSVPIGDCRFRPPARCDVSIR